MEMVMMETDRLSSIINRIVKDRVAVDWWKTGRFFNLVRRIPIYSLFLSLCQCGFTTD